MHGETAEVPCLTAVGCTTVFDLVEGLQILGIVRLHTDRPSDMLQRRHLIAHSVIGKGGQIVPTGRPN